MPRATTGALILPEYVVVERGGIRFGVVSVLDPAMRIVTMNAEDGGLYTVADPVATLREVIPRLRREAQTVVLVGHLGEATTETVLREVRGIDIAVVGHTYRNLQADHSALAEELLRFVEQGGQNSNDYVENLLIPLGIHDLDPFPMLIWGPDYARYRRSPQFNDFIRKSGALAYWQTQGFPAQCRPAENEGFECD